MNVPKEFIELVKNDIKRIDNMLSSNSNTQELLNLHKEIDSKYQSCISNWYQGLNEAVYQRGIDPYIDYYYLKGSRDDIIDNLSMFRVKLEIYTYGMNTISLPEAPTTSVNVTTNVGVNITFEQVRAKIEDMTSLTEEETQEIKAKLDELEEIISSKDKKKTKWEKVKPVLAWLVDKSFDVGMTLLPLLLKIQE